jgi:hypothetical protein
MRCLPSDFGWGDRGGIYADASCSLPAALEERCSGRQSALPLVLFADRNGAGTVTGVHQGGSRLSQIFHQAGTGECTEGDSETAAFAIGEPMELASFVPASLSRVSRPSGLVQTVAEVDDSADDATRRITVADFGQLATGALGGYACTLVATPDGKVRCAPVIETGGPQYSDPACTQPIWQTDWERFSVGTASSEIERATPGVFLPRVERVMTGGVPYDGPVYTQLGSDCSLIPGVPNARQPYRRASSEARLQDLPELRIIER